METIAGVTLMRHAVNLGKGAALKTAFNFALLQWPNASGFVTADADGQHAPADVLRVSEALMAEPDCMILGVRDFGPSVPVRSLFGNLLTRGIFRVVAGYSLRDTQTGLRGWPSDVCRHALRVTLNGYDFELETLVNSDVGNPRGTEIRQVPIETIYLDNNATSHFNPIFDSMRIYFVFARYCGSSTLTALVDYIVFISVLTRFNDIAFAQVCARIVAIMVAFTLVRNVVYRSNVSVIPSLLKFIALAIVTGVLSYSAIEFLNTSAGVPVVVAKLVAEGTLFLGNFAITRAFLFRPGAVETPASR